MVGTILLHFGIALIATLAFAILFQAPKSEWMLCGLTGGVGWVVYESLQLQGWLVNTFLLEVHSSKT